MHCLGNRRVQDRVVAGRAVVDRVALNHADVDHAAVGRADVEHAAADHADVDHADVDRAAVDHAAQRGRYMRSKNPPSAKCSAWALFQPPKALSMVTCGTCGKRDSASAGTRAACEGR